jgi:hypothetical protein
MFSNSTILSIPLILFRYTLQYPIIWSSRRRSRPAEKPPSLCEARCASRQVSPRRRRPSNAHRKHACSHTSIHISYYHNYTIIQIIIPQILIEIQTHRRHNNLPLFLGSIVPRIVLIDLRLADAHHSHCAKLLYIIIFLIYLNK